MTVCSKCKCEVEEGTGWMDEEIWDGVGVVEWLCDDCLFDAVSVAFYRGKK